MVDRLTEVNEIDDFKSFFDEHEDFQAHHVSNVSRIRWNGIQMLKLNLCSISYKSVKRDGSCFNSTKINALPLAMDCWKCLKLQLTENEESIFVNKHACKSRVKRMKFGLKHASAYVENSWEHV